MSPKINKMKHDLGITEAKLKEYGLIPSPMLSGRVLEDEKKKLVKLCKRKHSTQSEQIREELGEQIKRDINWDNVKILKGENIRGKKTVPVRIKVTDEMEKEVLDLCNDNSVTVSSFIRYVVVQLLNKNEVKK